MKKYDRYFLKVRSFSFYYIMSKLCLTYVITFWDFVLPGLRCVMAAKRAVLEAGLYEPAIRSIVHINTRTCIHYSVNGVHVGICCWISNTKMRRSLTVLVGCGMVGNSSRSSDLLMAPVSHYCNHKLKIYKLEEKRCVKLELTESKINTPLTTFIPTLQS